MQFGLIGKSLKHSYSKIIHKKLCNYTYDLQSLPTHQHFAQFMQQANFKGINVTIPYKKEVIPYCNFISDSAKQIGAINTIVNKNGKLHGYNTDYDGFSFMAKHANINFLNKHVMILGTGGTSLTVQNVVKNSGAKSITIVTRNESSTTINNENSFSNTDCTIKYITYNLIKNEKDIQILINTTPVGMYPNNDSSPINLLEQINCSKTSGTNNNNYILPNLHAVVDVIYNPSQTNLILCAKKRNLIVSEGIIMLVAQAKYAAELFSETKIPDGVIIKIKNELLLDMSNIVLIGMPSCGKSVIGYKLAKLLNRPFIDIDSEIVSYAGCSIEQIFKQNGEAYFRQLEAEMCKKFGAQTNAIISTGGGVVLNENNIANLKQNGKVFFINRKLELLQSGGGRPLSKSAEDVAKLYNNRIHLYNAFADYIVENNNLIEDTINNIKDTFYETTNS